MIEGQLVQHEVREVPVPRLRRHAPAHGACLEGHRGARDAVRADVDMLLQTSVLTVQGLVAVAARGGEAAAAVVCQGPGAAILVDAGIARVAVHRLEVEGPIAYEFHVRPDELTLARVGPYYGGKGCTYA